MSREVSTLRAMFALALLILAAAVVEARDINHSFLASEKGMIFRCKNRKVWPQVRQAWYGLPVPAEYAGGCAAVPAEVSSRWFEFTAQMNHNCQGFTFHGRAACPLPSTSDMMNKYGFQRQPRGGETYWYICYTCDDDQDDDNDIALRGGHVESRGTSDSWEFYPQTTARTTVAPPQRRGEISFHGKSLDELGAELRRHRGADAETKRGIAASFAADAFAFAAANTLGGRMADPAEQEKQASQLLKKAEESVGAMTNILSDDDAMTLDVRYVGSVTMVRRSSETFAESVLDGVKLPDQAGLRNDDGSLVASLLEFDQSATDALKPESLASNVIAVTAYDSQGKPLPSAELQEALEFYLEHTVEEGKSPQCAFWDFDSENWSTEGCEAVKTVVGGNSSTAVTTCRCRHLTNFAVILELASEGDLAAVSDLLRILTLVLCSISAVCLVLSLVYFGGHQGNERSDRVRINAHFCLNLLCVQVLLILGNVSTDLPAQAPGLCTTVGVLLHYFLLATFFWSLLSGHQIYVLLVEVFDAEKRRMKYYYVVGYLSPATIVIIALLVDILALGGVTYGTDTACWMRTEDLLFKLSFLLPLVAVLTVNLSMLVLVIAKVYRIKPRPQMFGQARGWLSLALLLGVTWAVGLLGKSYPSVTVAVSFVVLNSLQGMLIFIFHVLLSQRCRAKMSRELSSRGIAVSTSSSRVATHGRHNNTSSSSSSHPNAKFSRDETQKLSDVKEPNTEVSVKTAMLSTAEEA